MKYNVILADPPFRYEGSFVRRSDAIESHYPTMSLDELKALRPVIDEFAAKDCVLYLWAMSPKLAEAIELMAVWGFNYRTCGVWDKKIFGLGFWFRQQHEILLVGIRGKPGHPPKEVAESSVFRLRRTKHSEKPDYIRGYIERCFPNAKRIELFAREKYPQWDVWGLEAPESNSVLFGYEGEKTIDCTS